jgi:bifunctional non-homologous end joining protein LigD
LPAQRQKKSSSAQDAGDLNQYRAKRRFGETPEPSGAVESGQGPLRFVMQKHHASRLHYDLRLEVGGTLKSWAVPKGPSLVSHEKRLAVMVEDHPLEYLHFEGVIPKGNYGAGTMMVWDQGTYHVPGHLGREESEPLIAKDLERGRLHIVLHAHKLAGEFALVRTRRDSNEWLLFKKGETAGFPVTQNDQDRSVLSGRTMSEIAAGAPAVTADDFDVHGAPRGPMPRGVKPMLATLADLPFDKAGWVFELKWDGYRAIAEIDQRQVRLYSRNGLTFNDRYDAIVKSLQHVGHQTVLDGEVVVLDSAGRPQFQMLQDFGSSRKGNLVYQVFDVLYVDGHDLRKLPLLSRKQILEKLLRDFPNVRVSSHIEEHGRALFQAVSDQGLEGIVAKEAGSIYREGVRSQSWLKIKARMRQEAIIAGFTEGKGSRAGFGSLVLGVYDGDDLVYVGHTGTGFTDKSLTDIRNRLDPLIQGQCPFKARPATNGLAHWLDPRLVCEVSFVAWTNAGQMREPVFLGLREDKDPQTVKRERSSCADTLLEDADKEGRRTKSIASARLPNRNKPLLPSPSGRGAGGEGAAPVPEPRLDGAKQELQIDGHNVHLTNLSKLYWPDEAYTKGDLVQYYRDVSAFILPYLKDRPQSLNRHPNGIYGKSFFQKDVQATPEWVATVMLESEEKKIRSILCQDEATLAYMANLGCIEINPLNARTSSLDAPDYLLLDLDPEDIDFDKVIEVAQAIHKILERAGAVSLCKTSGKRGLHIYVPFGAQYSHEHAKHFAELIARIANSRLAATTSLVRNPSERQGRVYLDYLQNGGGKTLAAPYSARPYPGATVSAPLKWSEVRRGLHPRKFTIRTMMQRLDSIGDLWSPVLGPGIDLPRCLDRLASLLK